MKIQPNTAWLVRVISLALIIGLCATTASMHGQSSNEPTSLDSGMFLYHACQLRLKVIDDPNSVLTPVEATHALMCQSYIQGFVDGMLSSSHEFCIKPVTQEDATREYVSFMTKYPVFLKQDKMMSVALALHPLYKCDSKKR